MVIGAAGELPKPPSTPVVFLEGEQQSSSIFSVPVLESLHILEPAPRIVAQPIVIFVVTMIDISLRFV